MDVFLFLVSVLLLFLSKRIEWPIVGMLVLGNNYLGIGGFFNSNNLNVADPKNLGLVLMAMIIIVVCLRYQPQIKPMGIKRVKNYIIVFFVYLFLIILIDIVINGIDLWSVLRTSRHWLMLLMFVPLMRMPKIHLEKTLLILYYLTVIVSFIIVFEYLTGLYYFTTPAYDRYVRGNLVTRGSLPSTYALFYVLLVAMGYREYKPFVKYAVIVLLSFSLLLSATKSIALGLFLGFVILIFLRSKSFFIAFSRTAAVFLLALAIVALLPSLRYRLIEGGKSFGNEDDGSVTYRLMLTEERLDYISSKPITFLFGIGNVTEDHFQGVFQVGLTKEDGSIMQLDTGDISWALAILRLGVLGTLIWIGLSLVFVRSFSSQKNNPLSVLLISYILLNLLVLSTAGTFFYQGVFWVVPMICINIVYPIHRLDY